MKSAYEDDYYKDWRLNHNKFIDHIFELIIDNIYPGRKYYYWKFLDECYDPSYELVKKFQKLKKYEKEEFCVKNDFNELDQMVSAFEPSKKQFDFIVKVMLKKELAIKNIVKEAIKHLVRAKERIIKANNEMWALNYFMAYSEIVKDKQMVNSLFVNDFIKNDKSTISSIFDMKIEKIGIKVDLGKDPILGKLSKKILKKNRFLDLEFNSLKIGQEDEEDKLYKV